MLLVSLRSTSSRKFDDREKRGFSLSLGGRLTDGKMRIQVGYVFDLHFYIY